MGLFRVLPGWVRRALVRLGTPSYTVGAVLVLRRPDGSVLLVDQRHTGGWALPGGLLKRGEEPVKGLAREVSEEVGIVLDPHELPPARALVAPQEQRVDLVFVLDTQDDRHAHEGDPAEVRRIGWFPASDLPDVTEPTRAVLEAARHW
jgi:8-oxo-dGTP pyrophosphatase MutT (NUDIX family)